MGNPLHYQDLEWYEALQDSKLKEEALKHKAIMEGLISDDESSNNYWKRWKSYEINYYDYDETHDERQKLCGDETHKVTICQIKRYKMIKYSFYDDEEYVDEKEDEYDDLIITREEACRAYQEIFQMMDEGWTDLVKEINEYWWIIYKSGSVGVLKLQGGCSTHDLAQ
ncbi:hypothetical protein Tco_0735098 [Tanacetum coccineum]